MAIQTRVKKLCARCNQEFIGGINASKCLDCVDLIKNQQAKALRLRKKLMLQEAEKRRIIPQVFGD